jgi:hypothetical protein
MLDLLNMETNNIYPNIDFTRSIIEEEDSSQVMFITLSTIIRFKSDLHKGTLVTLGITYDIDSSIEDTYSNEILLSIKFHELVMNVYENGMDAIKAFGIDNAKEFDVDDPRL